MSHLLTLIDPNTPTTDLPGSVVVRPKRSQDEVSTPWIARPNANVEVGGADWEAAIERLGDERLSAVVLATTTKDPLTVAWRTLPAEWARWAVDPAKTAVVVLRARQGAERSDAWAVVRSVESDRIAFVPSRTGAPAGVAGFPALTPGKPGQPRTLVEAIGRASAGEVRAGLLQLHDFLDECHIEAQSSGTRDGDYWHALVHRREPDPSNAKYWFRRVGDHPVFARLAEMAAPLLQDMAPSIAEGRNWEPFAFVDFCEAVRLGKDATAEEAARRVQFAEMLLLLEHCVGTK